MYNSVTPVILFHHDCELYTVICTQHQLAFSCTHAELSTCDSYGGAADFQLDMSLTQDRHPTRCLSVRLLQPAATPALMLSPRVVVAQLAPTLILATWFPR